MPVLCLGDEVPALTLPRELAVGHALGQLLEPHLHVKHGLALLLVKQVGVGHERRAARHAAPKVKATHPQTR